MKTLKEHIETREKTQERIPMADAMDTEEGMRRVIQGLSDSFDELETRIAALEKKKMV